MQTAEIQEFGIDALQFVERPEPKPGPREVVVRMRAFSLNYRDIMVVEGQYNPKMRLPMVPLSDGAGEVVETGSEVTRVKAGDRVMGAFMQAWISGPVTEEKSKSALGAGIQGVAAEFVLFDEEGLVSIPEHLSYQEAATLPCAGVTAWRALVTDGHLQAGQKVLLLGTGGVSIFGLQFAKMLDARTIITSSSDEKLQRTKGLGADYVINYRVNAEWGKAARDLADGAGVDNILEVGGAGTLPQSFKAVRMGGTVSLIGVLSGAGEINFVQVFMRSLRLQGIFVGSREMFEDMNRAIAKEQMRPVVDRVFPFSELRQALHYMKSGSHFGKICIAI